MDITNRGKSTKLKLANSRLAILMIKINYQRQDFVDDYKLIVIGKIGW